MIFWIHTQTWPCPWVVSLTLNRRCISSLEWSVASLMVPSIPQAFQIRSSICSSANQSFSLRPRHAQWCFTQSLRWRCKTQVPLWWCRTCASKLSRNKSRTRISDVFSHLLNHFVSTWTHLLRVRCMLLFKHLVVFLTRATENSSLLATCLKVVLKAGDSSYIFGKLCENQYLTSANTHAGKGLELWAENDEERQRRSKTHTTSGLRPLKINKSPELMRQRSCRLVQTTKSDDDAYIRLY